MRLKHIFENAPHPPKMTVQQVVAALKNFRRLGSTNALTTIEPEYIKIDDQGLVHIDGDLYSTEKIARMPLQLQSVRGISMGGTETLEGLPRQLATIHLIKFKGSDLTSATEVTVGHKSSHGKIVLYDCRNLKTIEGIDNFKSGNGKKINIFIHLCDNLTFDPYDYADRYTFKFYETIPPRMPLVQAIALTSPDQIDFNSEDYQLEKIIKAYRGQSENMPHLSLKLARAGYRGYAGLT